MVTFGRCHVLAVVTLLLFLSFARGIDPAAPEPCSGSANGQCEAPSDGSSTQPLSQRPSAQQGTQPAHSNPAEETQAAAVPRADLDPDQPVYPRWNEQFTPVSIRVESDSLVPVSVAERCELFPKGQRESRELDTLNFTAIMGSFVVRTSRGLQVYGAASGGGLASIWINTVLWDVNLLRRLEAANQSAGSWWHGGVGATHRELYPPSWDDVLHPLGPDPYLVSELLTAAPGALDHEHSDVDDAALLHFAARRAETLEAAVGVPYSAVVTLVGVPRHTDSLRPTTNVLRGLADVTKFYMRGRTSAVMRPKQLQRLSAAVTGNAPIVRSWLDFRARLGTHEEVLVVHARDLDTQSPSNQGWIKATGSDRGVASLSPKLLLHGHAFAWFHEKKVDEGSAPDSGPTAWRLSRNDLGRTPAAYGSNVPFPAVAWARSAEPWVRPCEPHELTLAIYRKLSHVTTPGPRDLVLSERDLVTEFELLPLHEIELAPVCISLPEDPADGKPALWLDVEDRIVTWFRNASKPLVREEPTPQVATSPFNRAYPTPDSGLHAHRAELDATAVTVQLIALQPGIVTALEAPLAWMAPEPRCLDILRRTSFAVRAALARTDDTEGIRFDAWYFDDKEHAQAFAAMQRFPLRHIPAGGRQRGEKHKAEADCEFAVITEASRPADSPLTLTSPVRTSAYRIHAADHADALAAIADTLRIPRSERRWVSKAEKDVKQRHMYVGTLDRLRGGSTPEAKDWQRVTEGVRHAQHPIIAFILGNEDPCAHATVFRRHLLSRIARRGYWQPDTGQKARVVVLTHTAADGQDDDNHPTVPGHWRAALLRQLPVNVAPAVVALTPQGIGLLAPLLTDIDDPQLENFLKEFRLVPAPQEDSESRTDAGSSFTARRTRWRRNVPGA
jgi:hypothetical protein